MARVYRARHNTLQRPCAVKVLCPELLHKRPDSIEMFLAEARAAASLVHPHVVIVHNIGKEGDYNFIELEYVPGQSLQALRNSRPEMSPLDATGYLVQAVSALAAAHRQDMIHRDFKPSNILVRHDGVAKLADFGLAKRVISPQRMADQGLSGTPYYMAPELFQGEPGSKASDVYAVAISYFYLLTGRFPFATRNLVKLSHLHAEQSVPDPREYAPEIPPAAVDIVKRGSAKRSADRYRDGNELYADLLSAFTGMRSLRSIVDEAVEDMNASVQVLDGRIAVVVALDNGRTQTVYVEEAKIEPWATTIVRVYSICGPADESYFRRALELNIQIPHGSLALEQIDGTDHFVMLHSYLRASCDAIEIRHGLQDIARWGDDVEIALTGKDQF